MQREQLIQSWLLKIYPELAPRLTPVAGDASFRRYFRLNLANGDHYIVMDAPPQHEDCRPFVQVAQLLAQTGVQVPEILHADLDQGMLVLSDFGDTTYLAAITPDNAHALYMAALGALVHFQHGKCAGILPEYDRSLLMRELRLFDEWYVARHLGHAPDAAETAVLQGVYAALLDNVLAQPQVLVHRDYHSRNLMLTDAGPGILDFQDAVCGPITYDLVSLLRDAYIDWEEAQVLDWAIRYWEKARRAGLPVRSDFAEFYRDFEWMGMQRHLKVLGIFARLNYRDGKSGYLQDLPRVLAYVHQVAQRYRDFAPLVALLDRWHNVAQTDGLTF